MALKVSSGQNVFIVRITSNEAKIINGTVTKAGLVFISAKIRGLKLLFNKKNNGCPDYLICTNNSSDNTANFILFTSLYKAEKYVHNFEKITKKRGKLYERL